MTPDGMQQRIEQHDREIADMRALLNQTIQIQQINAQQIGQTQREIAELKTIVFANQEQIARNTEALNQPEL